MGFSPITGEPGARERGISMSVQRKDKGRMRWVAIVIIGETVTDLDLEAGDRVDFSLGHGKDSGIGCIRKVDDGPYSVTTNTENSLRFGFSGKKSGIHSFHPARHLEGEGVRDGIAYFRLPRWWPRHGGTK